MSSGVTCVTSCRGDYSAISGGESLDARKERILAAVRQFAEEMDLKPKEVTRILSADKGEVKSVGKALLGLEEEHFLFFLMRGECHRGVFRCHDYYPCSKVVLNAPSEASPKILPLLMLFNHWIGYAGVGCSRFRNIPSYLAMEIQGEAIRVGSEYKETRALGDMNIPLQFPFSREWLARETSEKQAEMPIFNLQGFAIYDGASTYYVQREDSSWCKFWHSGSLLKASSVEESTIVEVLNKSVVKWLLYRNDKTPIPACKRLVEEQPFAATRSPTPLRVPLPTVLADERRPSLPTSFLRQGEAKGTKDGPISAALPKRPQDGLAYILGGCDPKTTPVGTERSSLRPPFSAATPFYGATEDAEVSSDFSLPPARSPDFVMIENDCNFPPIAEAYVDFAREGAAESLLQQMTVAIKSSSSYYELLRSHPPVWQQEQLTEGCIAYYSRGKVSEEIPSCEAFVEKLRKRLGLTSS